MLSPSFYERCKRPYTRPGSPFWSNLDTLDSKTFFGRALNHDRFPWDPFKYPDICTGKPKNLWTLNIAEKFSNWTCFFFTDISQTFACKLAFFLLKHFWVFHFYWKNNVINWVTRFVRSHITLFKKNIFFWFQRPISQELRRFRPSFLTCCKEKLLSTKEAPLQCTASARLSTRG